MDPDDPPVGTDGFAEGACGACGGVLMVLSAPRQRKAWLRCAGCGRQFRLGPIFTDAVRRATGDYTLELDPLTQDHD